VFVTKAAVMLAAARQTDVGGPKGVHPDRSGVEPPCEAVNKLALRQTAGMVASLLKLAGLDWPVPDFSISCRRQKTLAVQIPYRRADGPLNLLVDSTGIKVLGDGEWQARKHGV